MKLRHHDLHIPEDGTNPFVNCKLDRKKYADVLTDIVSGYADGFVLAINNPWGEGKTTFVKMWRQHLINEEFPTLYFNAWENDFQQDVLVAFISELSELKNKPEKQFKDMLKKVVPLTGKILPSVIKHLIKRYGGDEAAQDIAEAFGEYTEDQLKELTDSYKEKKESIKSFKESLQAFAAEAGSGKPLVFIIDELDRCRPNYAVEVLEQIKHLFSVTGIVFVLSIDKEQLGHAVRGVYGSDRIDANEYLRRFIDLEYTIPQPNKRLMVNYLYDYYLFDDFFKSDQRGRQHIQDEANFKNFAVAMVRQNDFTLRKIEKMFSLSRVALKTVKYAQYVFPDLFLILIYLKLHKENIFKGLVQKKYSVQELIDETEYLFNNDKQDDNVLFIYAILGLALSYHNYFYEDAYPKVRFSVERNDRGDIIGVNYKSKFSDNDEHNSLVGAYISLRNRANPDSFNVKPILDRILLLEPIVN